MVHLKVDAVVIGGGIAGLTVGYYLAKLGMVGVAIVEKAYFGNGSSTRSLGRVAAVRWRTKEMTELALQNILKFERLSNELRFNVLYRRTGFLYLAYTEEEVQFWKRNIVMQNSVGVKSEFLPPERIKELVPQLNMEGVLGGAYHHRDGLVHHDPVIWAYLRGARRLGVKLYGGVEVTKIVATSSRVKGVETSAGTIEAPIVINAAGVNSVQLAERVGIRLPIASYKLEAFVTEPLKPFLSTVVRCDRPYENSFNQTLRGEIVGTAGDPDEKPSYSTTSSFEFLVRAANTLTRLLPPLRHIRIIRQWAGLLSLTPDRIPIAGETEGLEGFYQFNGLPGFQFAPYAAELLANKIVNGRSHRMLEMMNLSRFKDRPTEVNLRSQ